ncbi:DUF3291 domain-containing protein [Streptomyces sp. NPDC006879]|uniref:DUF3291 domain-containing protein n=1 Tax=Streptomyces sp. NPDC006879 TaxID=3364767 RepID=UPI0036800248
MPTLPWTVPNPPPSGVTVYVMASRFEVRSLRDVPRFFRHSMTVWNQIRQAPGAYGASLVARPWRRTFYTLSAWRDRDALYAFARTEPHLGVMRSMRSITSGSTFVFWQATAAELPIGWPEAMERLESEQREVNSTDPRRNHG